MQLYARDAITAKCTKQKAISQIFGHSCSIANAKSSMLSLTNMQVCAISCLKWIYMGNLLSLLLYSIRVQAMLDLNHNEVMPVTICVRSVTHTSCKLRQRFNTTHGQARGSCLAVPLEGDCATVSAPQPDFHLQKVRTASTWLPVLSYPVSIKTYAPYCIQTFQLPVISFRCQVICTTTNLIYRDAC